MGVLTNTIKTLHGTHEMFPYPREDFGGSNTTTSPTKAVKKLRFRTLARIFWGSNIVFMNPTCEACQFPSPLEDLGGSNVKFAKKVAKKTKFPSPLEDLGGSNLILTAFVLSRSQVSVPSRGYGGF